MSTRTRTRRNVTINDELAAQALVVGTAVGVPELSRIIDQALVVWIAQRGRGRPLPPTPSTRAGQESEGGPTHVSEGE